MTMNSAAWGGGGGMNPPEPMPMVKSRMDYMGGGGSGLNPANGSSGRQITKNPMNMIGGDRGVLGDRYSNGNSSFGFGGDRGNGSSGLGVLSGERLGDRVLGGIGDRNLGLGGGGGIGDRNGGGGLIGGDRMGSNGGIPSGMSMLTKMSQQQHSGQSNGTGYTQDGYGMGAMGRSQGQRSPPSGGGFHNGFSGGMGERNICSSNLLGERGGMGGMGYDRGMSDRGGMIGDRGGMMGDRGGGGGGHMSERGMGDRGSMFRDLQESNEIRQMREYQEMREFRELQYRKEMMGRADLVRSTSEIGPDGGGGMMGMDRGGMMSRADMDRMDRGGSMSTGHRDFMRSNSEFMGMRDPMRDPMRDRRLEGMDREPPYSRDMMRSMSASNGSYGNMGPADNYNRSMSFQGGPPSPPNDMKIGTWDDGQRRNTQEPGFPPVSNFEIGTFNINDPGSRSFGSGGGHGNNGATQSNVGPIQPGMGIRETGIIEKLLHSYGFIQCCDRQARLFFHFSQFEGNIEHLKIGDPVEFEMTYDRRTGKPIASAVSKIAPEVVMSEERVIGTVTTEIKINRADGSEGRAGSETQGRISYENRGECFFLPFNTADVEGNVTLATGDKVSFQMATVQRSGNLAAKTIRLENPAAPVKYQGVVNSLTESSGFIERADVVKEIFFHVLDMVDGTKEDNSHIKLGDDVEFIIQTRNGREVACNLTKLAPGTVVFEDVGTEFFRGQVLKPLDRSGKYLQTDPLPGRVKYRAVDRSEAEIPFGEKDQLGDFTLRHGDWIKFIVATDRRDKLRRATKIELLDESFKVSDERREQGVVTSLKEGGFGVAKCVDRAETMFFNVFECLDVGRGSLVVGDEVEFTVAVDPSQPTRQLATRIKRLPANTVKFDIIIAQNILGLVAEEPAPSQWNQRSPTKAGDSPVKEGAGRVVYELNGLQLSIPLYANDVDARAVPKVGDKVQFNINQLKSTKETNAVQVRILERANLEPVSDLPETGVDSPPRDRKESTRLGSPQRGYVAALKDGFGFIETLQHDKEIFFHFSHVEGKAEKLEVGQEVEYSIYSREKGGKVSAEGVKPLSKGSIPKTPVKEEVLYGKVVRPLRSVNPDQADYCGLIQSKSEEGRVLGEYQYGIASLINKKELLQEGDPVNFQVSAHEPFAVNIKSNKQKLRSHVEAVKGQFGFLSYEVEEGKKLFFHMSEVEGGDVLQVGDQVEFVVVTNQRSRKHSACCVRKLCVSQRPERLISKLKTMSIEEVARGGPRMTVIRQPRGPDGSRGFAARRRRDTESEPPAAMDLMEQLTAQ